MDLKKIEALDHFPDSFRAIKKAEIKILGDIKTAKIRTFYIDDYLENINSKTQYKLLKEARNILIKNSIIISVYDTQIYHYCPSLCNFKNLPFDNFVPKNKIINISYQEFKVPYEKFNHSDLNGWKNRWKEIYDYWIKDYYPKIKNNL